MNKFGKADLQPLLEPRTPPCISIYLPMARSSDKTLKNPIRYKNAIKSVEKQLEENGYEVREIRSVITQLEDAVDGFEFFQHQLDGLAVFFAEGLLQIMKLPVSFIEQVEVGTSFEIRPLLQAMQNDMDFYILALSQENARLFRASKFNIAEIQLSEDTPTSFEEAMRYDKPEDQLQHQVLSGTDGGNTPIYHGHTESDQTKKHLRRYFRMLDRGIVEAISDHELPVLMIGLDYLHPVYQDASKLPNILDKGVYKNPDDFEVEKIHELAWQRVERLRKSRLNQAIDKYKNLSGTEKSNADIEKIPLVAINGRVDTLFVEKNNQLWGEVNIEEQEVKLQQNDGKPKDTELINFSIKHTLLNSGKVFVLDEEQMPKQDSLAGVILRY